MTVLLNFNVAAQFFSQNGQDEFVAQLLNNKCKGIFVDIGASDGIRINNSYYFEKFLGWQGICVEPRSSLYEKLVKNRNCFCINACIAKKECERNFCEVEGYAEDLSGLFDSYHPSHLTRINSELKIFGGSKRIYKVKCLPLSKLLENYNFHVIDFLSIDTEGSEFEILSSIDFTQVIIRVICIENLYNDLRINNLLVIHGFVLKKHLGGDDIYMKNIEK